MKSIKILLILLFIPSLAFGAQLIFEDDFDDWEDWDNDGRTTVPANITWWDSTSGNGSSYGLPDLQINTAAGRTGKGFRSNVDRNWSAAGLHRYLLGVDSKHRNLIFQWDQKYSSDFSWKAVANSPGHKWIRLGYSTDGSTNTKIFRVGLRGAGDGTNAEVYSYGVLAADIRDFDDVGDGYTWTEFGVNTWRTIRVQVIMNTTYPGSGSLSNGTVSLWIDGILKGTFTDANIALSKDVRINYIQLGGNMSEPDMVNPNEYQVDIDNFKLWYVGGREIKLGGTGTIKTGGTGSIGF